MLKIVLLLVAVALSHSWHFIIISWKNITVSELRYLQPEKNISYISNFHDPVEKQITVYSLNIHMRSDCNYIRFRL